MKVELNIDKAALITKVCQEYGIHVESLTFLPEGEVAYCYVAHCANGDRYFLKLFSDSRLGQISASRLDFYLPLTWNLYSKNILPNIPYPIRTLDGRLKTCFDDHPLVLFNCITGRRVGYESPLSDEILTKLASLVGILHRSTPEISVEHPRFERFDLPFEADLLNGLEALERITPNDNHGPRELQKLLLPRKDEILGHLNRLQELQHLAKAVGKELVLCHTDLHGGNLIMNDRRDLYILDWEGALIAPLEHDLFIFAGEDRFFDLFLPNYERELGPVSLDSRVLGFYFYRRNLEDLTDWIVRILYENTDEEQNRHDLEGIIEDCISGWPYLETTVEEIATKLTPRCDWSSIVEGGNERG